MQLERGEFAALGGEERLAPQRPSQPADAEHRDAASGQPRAGDDDRVEQLVASVGAAAAGGSVGGQLASQPGRGRSGRPAARDRRWAPEASMRSPTMSSSQCARACLESGHRSHSARVAMRTVAR